MTTQPRTARLTADAFIARALRQPQGRFEVAGGEVVAMAPSGPRMPAPSHTRLYNALSSAIAARRLECEATTAA